MKNLGFLFLLMGSLVMMSCGKEDTHMHEDDKYDATIEIMSPVEGAEVSVGEEAHVHVDFTRPDNKIIHNVKIEVLQDGAVVSTLLEEHTHQEGAYTFHGEGFTPDMHGAYVLRATTSTDAGDEEVTQEVNFTAVHDGHHGGDYKVNIDIVKPVASASVAINTALEVEVIYTHETSGELIHNVMIDILDVDGKTVGTLVNEHTHSEAYTYTQADAWTPTIAGTYTLRAMTTDANQENRNMMMREFKVE